MAVEFVRAGAVVTHWIDAGQAALVGLLIALVASLFRVGCISCHATVVRCEAA